MRRSEVARGGAGIRLGLVGRIVLAGAFVFAFLVVELALFVVAVTGLRSAADAQRNADVGTVAVVHYQTVLVDLETGQRGYVIARRRAFLDPWRRARAALPAAGRALIDTTRGTPLEGDAREIVALGRSYVEWSVVVVRLVAVNPAAASARAASGEGVRRVTEIRRRLVSLRAAEAERIADARARVDSEERRGIWAGVAGIVAAALLFLGIVGYFLRSAVAPLRRVAAGTARVAAGDLSVRVPETGAGEVAYLARSFNAMTASLERSQEELEHQVNVTRTVLDSTVDGILLTDEHGDIVLLNRPMLLFARDLRLPLDGTAQERLLAVADRFTEPDRFRAAIGRITTDLAEPTTDEFEFADSHRCFQGFTMPVIDEDGGLAGRVWTLREVTAERAADRLKDDFIATVSHELRTPLTSIVGFLEMMLDDDRQLTEEQRRFLEIVMRSSQRLMRQVADLLFVSQLDSAGLVLHPEEVDLAALVRDAVDEVAALARQRALEIELAADGPIVVTCDRERVDQVVGNLLSNAIKFTPPGGAVRVRVARSPDGAVAVEVDDTGIGIPEPERDRLFERFFRSSRSAEQAIQGSGLGLAISKAIVEAHGGTIAAEPLEGGGTRLRFDLPPAAVAAAVAEPAQ